MTIANRSAQSPMVATISYSGYTLSGENDPASNNAMRLRRSAGSHAREMNNPTFIVLTDEQLIDRMRDNDTAAFEALYDRHAARVMAIAFKVIRDRTAAEDIVQESFWRAWQRSDSFDKSRGSGQVWLFRIARNHAIDTWRRRVRQQAETDADDDMLNRIPDSSPNTAEVADAGMEAEKLREAIITLPPEQRVIIEQSYFHGKTRREIAAEQDIPLGTVHTRARLGLQRLRRFLEEANGSGL